MSWAISSLSSFKKLMTSGLGAPALAFRPLSSVVVNLPRRNGTTKPTKSTMIDFSKGHPNRKLIPMQEMREIFAKVALQSNEESLKDSLNYPKSDPGDPQFLLELGAFMDRHTKNDDLGSNDISSSSSDATSRTTHLFTTTGVSHGLDMLCSAQTAPGNVVLMENPTYFLAAGIFRSHGLQVQSLPMKRGAPGGVDMDQLELSLENGELQAPRMIYVIPTHQNPTARVMPIGDRWRLAKLAHKYGIMVVADEVYHLLDWRDVDRDGPRPARMAVIGSNLDNGQEDATTSARPGCCVTASSFTKIFAPGVRCGWIEGPKFIIESLENLGYIQSQGGCTPLVGELMRTSLSEGIGDRVLANLNTAFQERSNRLCQILSSDKGIHFDTKPLGGYFVWVSFDGINDTGSFLSFCSERGVRFLPGERCDVSHGDDNDSTTNFGDCRRWARFCFADLELEDLEKGASLVVQCYREYLKEPPPK
jgi:2-aminoadipate transaminase